MTGGSIIGRSKWEVDTPALLLDMEAVEANLARMAEWFEDRPCGLRPHFKTHKLPLIARMQVEAGAVGIACAKLSEAQVLLEHGIRDVLIANQVVGQEKVRRLVGLAGWGRLTVCVDDAANAEMISARAAEQGRRVDVLIEVNVGLNRCGVAPGRPALELAGRIAGLPGLGFQGLMGYEGGLFIKDEARKEAECRKANRALVETRDLLEKNGFPVRVVSAGGSNTYRLTGSYPGVTEVQAGSYVTMDTHSQDHGLDFRPALSLMTTVVSRPEPGRAVIDAGLKAVSQDLGLPRCGRPEMELVKLNEEHGHLRIKNPDLPLGPGDKIELIPSHGCTTIPLHDRYVLVRGRMVESVTPIAGRGALT